MPTAGCPPDTRKPARPTTTNTAPKASATTPLIDRPATVRDPVLLTMTFPSELRATVAVAFGMCSEWTAGTDGCQTREIPTKGVVEGCGDPPAGSRETAKTTPLLTPWISSMAPF